MKEKNKDTKFQALKNWLFMADIFLHTKPLVTGFMLLTFAIQEAMIFVEHVVAIRYVLDAVETGKPMKSIVLYIGLLAVGIAAYMIMLAFSNAYYRYSVMPPLQKEIADRLLVKVKELDLSCYDNPEYYNNFVIAMQETEQSVETYLDNLDKLVRAVVSIVCYASYFLVVQRIGLIFIAFSCILTLIISWSYNKNHFSLQMEKKPSERRREYINRVFYLQDYAKENRMNPVSADIMMDDFERCNNEILEIEQKKCKKMWLLGFLSEFIPGQIIMNGFFVLLLIYQAMITKQISFSLVVVLLTAAKTLSGKIIDIVGLVPVMMENSLYIGKIHDFLRYESTIQSQEKLDVPANLSKLEMEHISFRYDRDQENIINNLSLTIRPGEHIAIVGYNGAGKTTLVKLLMRLYDVTDGSILLDGKNIKSYDVEKYRKQFGAVFQDFKLYAASLKENVLMDDPDLIKYGHEEEHNVRNALSRSGFDERLAKMKNDLDTQLLTEFDPEGEELSGGEQQKVAIARVLYSNSRIIIMDEPSSALDPIAEYKLNQTMKQSVENKTVIYISHRLSTTKDSDRIIMMENGRIVEMGNHDELLEKGGKYAHMWYVQAGRYQYLT